MSDVYETTLVDYVVIFLNHSTIEDISIHIQYNKKDFLDYDIKKSEHFEGHCKVIMIPENDFREDIFLIL